VVSIFWGSLLYFYMFLVLFKYNVIISSVVFFTCVSCFLLECDVMIEFFPPVECVVYFLSCGRLFLCCSWFQCVVSWVLQGIPCLIIALVHYPQMFYNGFISFMIYHYSLPRHPCEEAHFWHLSSFVFSLVKVERSDPQRSIAMAVCSNVFSRFYFPFHQQCASSRFT
jgi:hypothetical protein